MSDTVLYEVTDGVAVMTLNRPESLNAMNPEMLGTMYKIAQQAADDPAVRCVVVTGAGRGFSAGGDVKGMGGNGGAGTPMNAPVLTGAAALREQEEFSRLLQEMPKPTIAAINGVAAGAGLSVALSADIRISSDQARFTTAFSKIGFSGDFGGTWLLQRLVGNAKARELYFFSDIFDAQTALSLGIVSRVVPHAALMEETMSLARKLASGPTLAYARIKDNFSYGATHSFGETLTREAENMTASSQTQDHKDAARAFVEKREPQFHGR